jgi:hypothetical protein
LNIIMELCSNGDLHQVGFFVYRCVYCAVLCVCARVYMPTC